MYMIPWSSVLVGFHIQQYSGEWYGSFIFSGLLQTYNPTSLRTVCLPHGVKLVFVCKQHVHHACSRDHSNWMTQRNNCCLGYQSQSSWFMFFL